MCNKGEPEVSLQGLHRRNSKQTKKLELHTCNLKIDFGSESVELGQHDF